MFGPPRRVLYGVALVCFANLLLEVVLTRIFSTTMYYHLGTDPSRRRGLLVNPMTWVG